MSKVSKPFEGVLPNLERLYEESESEFTRNRLKAFMNPQFCDACNGQRLKREVLAVTLQSSSEFRVQSSGSGTAETSREAKGSQLKTRRTYDPRPLDHGRLRDSRSIRPTTFSRISSSRIFRRRLPWSR